MKRVLVVDNSKQVWERLASLQSEYPKIQIVGQAGNGKEAMDALNDQQLDTVILDVRQTVRVSWRHGVGG